MKKIAISLILMALASCSNLSPYENKSPVDEALKTCGLGYISDVGPMFKVAFDYASKKGGADFSANMRESLSTQLSVIATNDAFLKGMDSKDKLSLVQGTQECVIKYSDALRQQTGSELIRACMDDLQDRVAGKGKSWPLVRNYGALPNHPKYSALSPIVGAYIDKGGASSYNVLVQCNIKNGKYDDLVPIEN